MARHENSSYPVIDLFAGPGGLGEGFAAYSSNGQPAFQTTLSVEKDRYAHQTLELRHFYRAFRRELVPDQYYQYLRGEISRTQLLETYPAEAEQARQTAWLCTLGEEKPDIVSKRIHESLQGTSRWVLVGGPPCQAYSLVGRSRMMGRRGFEDDPRHFLYKQYLTILANHKPTVFVMENVKGLLSAQNGGESMIRNILTDLASPEMAVNKILGGVRYRLYSLSEPGEKIVEMTHPASFIVRAENYGIPQARHRIFIVGVRDDFDATPRTLKPTPEQVSVEDVIGDMPRIRSGVSRDKTDSYDLWLSILREVTTLISDDDRPTDRMRLETLLSRTLGELLEQEPLERTSLTYSKPRKLAAWLTDNRLNMTLSHESRSHMASDLHRYLYAAVYASACDTSPKLADFPETLLPNHSNVESGRNGEMFADRFRVQRRNYPSTTITSHISKDGHYFIHYDPTQCRSLTVREAARLQTFPDNYKFEGNRTAQYHQIGNAVPPYLASQIAGVIHALLESVD